MFHATNGFDKGCLSSRGLKSWPITEVNTEVLKGQLPGKRCLSRFLKRNISIGSVLENKKISEGMWFASHFLIIWPPSNFCRSTTWRIPLKRDHEAFETLGGECSNSNYHEPPKLDLVPKCCHSSGILSSRSAVSLLTCFSSSNASAIHLDTSYIDIQ